MTQDYKAASRELAIILDEWNEKVLPKASKSCEDDLGQLLYNIMQYLTKSGHVK